MLIVDYELIDGMNENERTQSHLRSTTRRQTNMMRMMILFCFCFYFIVHFLSATNTTENNIYHADSHLQGLFYQQQAHDHIHNTAATVRHRRPIHPKFRLPWLHHPVDSGRQPTTTLLQILTLKPQMRSAENFFQQHLRAFFGHQHDKQHPAPTRSNIKTGLR